MTPPSRLECIWVKQGRGGRHERENIYTLLAWLAPVLLENQESDRVRGEDSVRLLQAFTRNVCTLIADAELSVGAGRERGRRECQSSVHLGRIPKPGPMLATPGQWAAQLR